MRKILALLIGLAFVPSAHAETTLSGKVQISPTNAGTPKRPQGVKLMIGFDLATTEGEVHPVVTGFEVWHGPGLAFDQGGPYAECSRTVMAKMGPDGCSPKSKLGLSTGIFEDPIEPAPKFVIFNGPGRRPLAYMTLQRPARVRAVVPSMTTHNARSAWPNRMSFTIPQTMRVVAGIPITIGHLRFAYGHTKAAPLYVASTSCPRGGWRWRIRVHTMDAAGTAAVLQTDGRAPCTVAARR